MYRSRTENKKRVYQSAILDQAHKRKDQEEYQKQKEMQAEIECEGLIWECWERDKLVDKDKKKMNRFLEEQMKNTSLNRAYQEVEDKGRRTDDSDKVETAKQMHQYREKTK